MRAQHTVLMRMTHASPFVAANFAFRTFRKRKVQCCAVAAPLRKNLFFKNIFASYYCPLFDSFRGAMRSVPPFGIIYGASKTTQPFVINDAASRGLGDVRKTSPAVTVFDGYVKNRSSRRAHAILWRCAYRAVHPCASGTQFANPLAFAEK